MYSDKLPSLVITACLDPFDSDWMLIGREISGRVIASRRLLIVRDELVEAAKKTNPQWSVVSEIEYLQRIPGLRFDAVVRKFGDRAGWYVQQFAKIGALISEPFGSSVVWDADTLPLKKFDLSQAIAAVPRYGSHELNPPYFSQIGRFLGLEKEDDLSHIGQVMFVRGEWMGSFSDFVIERHGENWGVVLMDSILASEKYGFSEFELLGTFFSRFFSDQLAPMSLRWSRHGYKYFSSPRIPSQFPGLGLLWHHLSFETWEKRGSFLKWPRGHL